MTIEAGSVNKDLEMARRIAEAVESAGGRAYYVGGFVRDRLMGKENKDIDIEIHGLTVEQTEGILDSLGKRTVMGASFGVFGLEHYGIDIAMPRKEHANGRGHKDFEVYVDPFIGPEKACIRRDFTINAMMEDVLTGEILDFFNGKRDLTERRIRHVNSESFAEDPLRVLRCAQFASRFEFAIDPETESLCESMDLTALTAERVMGEAEKALLKAEKPSVYFEALRRMNALEYWFPELKALIGVPQDERRHPEGDVWTHTMRVVDEAAHYRDEAEYPLGLMMAAVCHDLGKPCVTELKNGRIHAYGHETEGLAVAERLMKRMGNQVRLHKYILNMVELHMLPNKNALCAAKQKSFMHMYDRAKSPEDLLLLAKADALSCCKTDDRNAAAEFYVTVEEKLRDMLKAYRELMNKPQVMGRDLAAAGIAPGPRYAKALEYAHKLHLAGIEKEEALRQTLGMIRSEKN